MKAGLFVFATSIILLFSCNSGHKEKNANPDVVIEDTVFESPPVNEDSGLHVKNESMLWHIDETKGMKLEKPKVTGIDTMSVNSMIMIINANYDSIHVDYIKTSHDTMYVRISNSEILTEQIGSTGAEMYLASTTWSLTGLKGISYVNYDFEEGDHASPGVYKRTDFEKFQSPADIKK